MIRKYIILTIALFIMQWDILWAKQVEYERYAGFYDLKDLQLVWSLEANKAVSIKDYTHTIGYSQEYIEWKIFSFIPKYTEFEKIIIDKIGFDRFNNLVNKKIIKLQWSKNRFIIPKNDRNSFQEIKYPYYPIDIKSKKILKTNMFHTRIIRIESETDQVVKFDLYPISPEYYSAWYDFEAEYSDEGTIIPDEGTIITLYDTTQEYYDVKWYIKNNVTLVWSKNDTNKSTKVNSLTINKKYVLFSFTRKKADWKKWTSKSLLPNYEFSTQVSKWVNYIHLNYNTYQFPNEPLQIK